MLLPFAPQPHQAQPGLWLLILLSFRPFPNPSNTGELHTLAGTALWGTVAAVWVLWGGSACRFVSFYKKMQ